MEVRWLRKALRNLEQLHAYICEDNQDAATSTVLKIQAAVEQLAKFPSQAGSVLMTMATANKLF